MLEKTRQGPEPKCPNLLPARKGRAQPPGHVEKPLVPSEAPSLGRNLGNGTLGTLHTAHMSADKHSLGISCLTRS